MPRPDVFHKITLQRKRFAAHLCQRVKDVQKTKFSEWRYTNNALIPFRTSFRHVSTKAIPVLATKENGVVGVECHTFLNPSTRLGELSALLPGRFNPQGKACGTPLGRSVRFRETTISRARDDSLASSP